MANYIEQLMKAAGVEPYKRSYFECKGGRSTICLCPQIGVPNAWCKEDCNGEEMQEKVEFFYPDFTPAKQLELIKLIVEKCQEIKIYKNKYMDSFLFQAQESWGEYEYKADVENFDSCLATLILEILKNNKLDKTEVRRILEDD